MVFGFWSLLAMMLRKKMKILGNLCLHFARQDGQDGKKPERKSCNLSDHNTKNQKTKIWDERNISLRYGLKISFGRDDSLHENIKLPNHCQISNWKCFSLILIFDSQ